VSALSRIAWPGLTGVVEILILAAGFYVLFMFFREARRVQAFVGLLLLLIVLMGITRLLHVDVLNWLLRRFSMYLAVALLVIFQPEIRRALAELGRQPLLQAPAQSRDVVDNLVEAVRLLAERRIGALIAIERRVSTRAIQDTGVHLDCRVNAELLASIFYPHTPLHDGGVIIRGNRIVAAGCLFPLSQRPELSRGLGTRHRAAMGLTEETDAIVIVVSEETGTISISTRGRLSRDFSETRLRRFLTAVLVREPVGQAPWRRLGRDLDLGMEHLTPTGGEAEAEERPDVG